MEIMTLLILLGVALIDGKLWKMMSEQKRHNRATEALLAEIRDRGKPAFEGVGSGPQV